MTANGYVVTGILLPKTGLDRAGNSAILTQMLKNNSQVVILVVVVVNDAVGSC